MPSRPSLYCLSVVVITYEMSYKIANTSWIQLAFSGVLVAGICEFHSSLRQVILVQLVLMGSLLVLVALPFLFNAVVVSERMPRIGSGRPIRLIRRVTEDEAIAEFLKSEFYRPVFRDYQDKLHDIVSTPNLKDPRRTPNDAPYFSFAISPCGKSFPRGRNGTRLKSGMRT